MSLVSEQHSMRNPRAVLHWYDFLWLHRTESKRGPCAAWFSSGRTDIPEIHPEIPHRGISKKLNVLFIPSSGMLARVPGKIRLLDIYRASGAPPAFGIHSYGVEPKCPSAAA
jgi:hypothetical protein